MSRDRLADAYEEQAALYARLADATAQIAHELRGIEQRSLGAAESGAAGAHAASPLRSAAPDDLPPLPPLDDEPPLKPQVEAGLGKCPVHGKPWVIKPAGVGKKGPYDAFWKCAERDADGYCNLKPQKIWRDTHPIREGAAA